MDRIILLLVAAMALMAGCSRPGVKGNGVVTTTNSPVAPFSKVRADGAYQIRWSRGEPGISVSTDQNLLPLITTSVSGDTLHIDSKGNLRPTQGITIILSSASLSEIELNGAVSLTASNVSGSELKLDSSGASSIYLEGTVTDLEANFSGAGRLAAKGLQAQTAKVSLSGACSADVTVAEKLSASVSGAGRVAYGGNPQTVEKDVSGAGKIDARQ